MKNLIVILVSAVILTACGSKSETKTVVASPKAPSQEMTEKVLYNNPSFVGGSSFGEFFLSMLRTQNYDMALKFTAKGSIEKYGKEAVKKNYEAFEYNYNLALRSISKNGDTLTLAYSTNEFATGKLKKMLVIIENDSCKLITPENTGLFLK